MERDPRKDPRPGDIHAGPVIQLRVERAMEGIGGLEYVECSMAFYGSSEFKGSRRFTPAQFQEFVGGDKTEVLHVAGA